MTREWVPGSDTATRIADAEQELKRIVGMVGRLPVGSVYDNAMTRVDVLSAEITRLRAEPHTEAGYRYVPTGLTFEQHWMLLSPSERNAFLRSHNVRLDYGRANGETTALHVHLNDLAALLGSVDPSSGSEGEAARIVARIDAQS